jgi:hypothetical protein
MDETPVGLAATGGRMDRVRSANRLRPAARKGWWIGVGLAVQLIAVAIPTAFVVVRAKHEDFAGLTFRSTVLVAARDALHDKSGVAALVGATILFALGCMVLARPCAFGRHAVRGCAARGDRGRAGAGRNRPGGRRGRGDRRQRADGHRGWRRGRWQRQETQGQAG